MKVDAAESAEKALTMLASTAYDIILCDFNLPHLSGEQFLAEVQQSRGSSAPRFIFITGELVDAERMAELARRNATVLQKPFRLPELAKLLSSLLQAEA